MGIETGALLTALASSAATAAVGAIATKALTPKSNQQAQTVKPVTEADKPAEAKAVDLNAIKNKNALAAAASGQFAGNNSTLLTGSNGVDSGGLNLGTSTLLGQ